MVSQFYLAEERRIRRGRRIWNVVSELVLAEVHPVIWERCPVHVC